ncbi:MAG: hypothetical protein ACP5JG_10820 [Anaerolineae bacterium]
MKTAEAHRYSQTARRIETAVAALEGPEAQDTMGLLILVVVIIVLLLTGRSWGG